MHRLTNRDCGLSASRRTWDGVKVPCFCLHSSESKADTGPEGGIPLIAPAEHARHSGIGRAKRSGTATADTRYARSAEEPRLLRTTNEAVAALSHRPKNSAGAAQHSAQKEATSNGAAAAMMANFQRRNLHIRTSPSPKARDEDWDAEARKLLGRVNVSLQSRTAFNHLDCIYQHPTTQAKLFVGNQTAARNVQLLEAENIYRIVNCQELTSCNFFEGDARFEYRRFPVSRWREAVNTDEDILNFFEEGCHAWIAQNLEAGRNVLVHCLAGAHRAGTTGVSFMMREGRFGADTAIRLAKSLRPVIDPFGSLLELLERLERAYAASGRAALSPTSWEHELAPDASPPMLAPS